MHELGKKALFCTENGFFYEKTRFFEASKPTAKVV